MVDEKTIKQEETEKNFSLWKFLRESHFDMLIVFVLSRILKMPGSLIEFIDEKSEYSLALFLTGGAFLILWVRVRRALFEEEYKKIRLYLAVPLVITIYSWVRAIVRFFELF
jgi:hypothetical protein